MARSVRIQLACSLLLGVAATSTLQDLAGALEADSECTAESCALELAQLRATKVARGGAGPSHVSAHSRTKGSSLAHQSKAHVQLASQHKAHANSTKAVVRGKAGLDAKPSKATSQAKVASKKAHVLTQATSDAGEAAHKSGTEGGRVKASTRKQKTRSERADKSSKSADTPDYGHPAWLSSCKRIFLDIGANIGVSIRKLFEAQKYPGSRLLPFFDEHFGELPMRQAAGEQSGLCALGLEPNPEHRERLLALEEAYGNSGWRVHFYPFAAWDAEGEMPLNTTGARPSEDPFHRGAHLSMHLAEGQPVLASSLVRTVNLASFLDSLPGVSLALMDIEGAEYETLAQLMMEKKLCQSSLLNLLVEAHDWGDISKWGGPASFSQGVHPRSTLAIGERLSQMAEMGWCPEGDGVTYVAKLDDPSYATDVDENFGR